MKIKSKFKDYYDYISYQYGGGDEKCAYERSPVKEILYDVGRSRLLYRMQRAMNSSTGCSDNISGRWVIVAGEAFLISNESFKHKFMLARQPSDLIERYSWLFDSEVISERFKHTEFTKWCKIVGAPVFTISSIYSKDGKIYVCENVPVLGDYGFASIIPAEQMYQNISMFITNELTEQMEMPTMSDKEKIVSHGFDNKTSFRGKN